MKKIPIGSSNLVGSRLAYGCMRIAGDGSASARDGGRRAIHAALDAGYTVFDHADIYSGGASESLFGEVMAASPSLRDGLVIIGKCGIRLQGNPDDNAPQRYDFSARHIVSSVEASLARLRIDRLDLLLLHRPDFLMRADEVAGAFERLHAAGKVGHFGVSNFSASQVELLRSVVERPLLVNQVEINIHNVDALTNGVLDQCQRVGMTPQAWCPVAGVAYPAWGNTFSADDDARIRRELDRQQARYKVSASQVALAWLLRLPAVVMPIIGSTTPERIAGAVAALDVDYAREDWYRLLEARNGAPVP